MTKFVCNCLTIFNCICDFVWYTWGYLKTEKMCRNEVFNLSKNVSSIDHRFWIELSVKFVRNSVVWQIWKLKLDKKDCQSFVRLQSSETFKENTDLGIPSFFFFFLLANHASNLYTYIYENSTLIYQKGRQVHKTKKNHNQAFQFLPLKFPILNLTMWWTRSHMSNVWTTTTFKEDLLILLCS